MVTLLSDLGDMALSMAGVLVDVVRAAIDAALGWLERHPVAAGTLFAVWSLLLFGIAGGIEAGTIPLPF